MTGGPPPLADAAEPLGKLQRGLGSGYLWALDAHRSVAQALLVHCLFNDPRWDQQLDARDEYYATLALDIELDLQSLEAWLRDNDEESAELEQNVLGMLGRMAIRDHAEAARVLRDYVAYGRSWQRAITLLTGDPEMLRAGVPWPEAVAGLDGVLVERLRARALSPRRWPTSIRATGHGRCGRSRTTGSRARWRPATACRCRRARAGASRAASSPTRASSAPRRCWRSARSRAGVRSPRSSRRGAVATTCGG